MHKIGINICTVFPVAIFSSGKYILMLRTWQNTQGTEHGMCYCLLGGLQLQDPCHLVKIQYSILPWLFTFPIFHSNFKCIHWAFLPSCLFWSPWRPILLGCQNIIQSTHSLGTDLIDRGLIYCKEKETIFLKNGYGRKEKKNLKSKL